MAHPVNQPHPQQLPANQPDAGPARAQAPGGVGNAPSTLQPAETRPAPEKGYIETGVLWLKDMVVMIFSTIYSYFASCFGKAEPAPQVQPPAVQQPLVPAPPPIEPPRLSPEVQADIDIMNAFRRLPAETQKRIYFLIGSEKWKAVSLDWFRDKEEIGKIRVQENPQVLRKHIPI